MIIHQHNYRNKKQKEIKLPGSYKQRKKARDILQYKQTGENEWLVWGGLNSHKVSLNENNQYMCDCYRVQVLHQICSHILKVRYNDLLDYVKQNNPIFNNPTKLAKIRQYLAQ